MSPEPGAPSISRRDLVARGALVAGVAAFAPYAFVRRASAASLHRFVDQVREDANLPGVTVAVVRGHHVVWSSASGWADIERRIPATPDTAFMLASVSKTVTCAAIMTLVEDGAIDLDADVNGYLPFAVHVPAAPGVPITMRRLLTHTSAIRDRGDVWGAPRSNPTLYFHGDSPIALGEFEESYLAVGGSRYRATGNFYQRAPGAKYSYSNLAVALAGFVAEAVSGVDFDALCRRRILRPLGMSESGFRLGDLTTRNIAMPYSTHPKTGAFRPYFQYGYPDYPDGALRTSAVHLARWLGAFMNFGAFDGVRVLERDTVDEIRRNQIPSLVDWHQGLIWYGIHGQEFSRLGHTGGDYGVNTRMFFRTDRNVGVVSLTNAYLTSANWQRFSQIERRLLEEFA
jgi:CubicO group peptidase (beta-lactamase class C family)